MPRDLGFSILLRRSALVTALMFWQGGFTFYAAVVVPIGQQVLGSHFAQGLITRQVTIWLNLAGMAALILMAWDLATAQSLTLNRLGRWAAWSAMLILLVVLFWLHQYLDSFIDLEIEELREPRQLFRVGHRWYLWISTIQWVFAVVFIVLTLQAWRAEDRTAGSRMLNELPGA
jgi:hypothetical protein